METEYKRQIAGHNMEYEEIYTIAALSHEEIHGKGGLRDQVKDLKHDLAEMTSKRDYLDMKLKEKEKEYDELYEKYERTFMDLVNEKQAHRLQREENQRLEEEIKDLKKQISDLLEQINELNDKIAELNAEAEE